MKVVLYVFLIIIGMVYLMDSLVVRSFVLGLTGKAPVVWVYEFSGGTYNEKDICGAKE